MAELEKPEELSSESSDGGVHDGESELAPHAAILPDQTWMKHGARLIGRSRCDLAQRGPAFHCKEET